MEPKSKSNKRKGNSSDAISQSIIESIFPLKPSKAQLRKIQIMKAALQTFAHIDIAYISYEDIARKAKTSKNLILHHFPKKEELFEFLMLYVRSLFQKYVIEQTVKESTAVLRLKRYGESCMEWVNEFPEHAKVIFLSHYFTSNNYNLRVKHRELTEMGQKRIVVILEQGISEGTIQNGEVVTRAKNIQKIIMGGLTESLAECEAEDRVRLIKIVGEAVLDMAKVKF
jgi:AcrR family transcriptional regulator